MRNYRYCGAALIGLLLATDCTQPAAGHCDNNGGDSACAEWYPDAPYCWVCTGLNQGCGAAPPTDPTCIPGAGSTSVASTGTDASTSSSSIGTSASTTPATGDTTLGGESSTGSVCGDGVIEGAEVCDGDDVGGLDCAALRLGEGTLGCTADCTDYDLAGCAGMPVCGDGVIQGNEDCDGIDLGMRACSDLGFAGGTLSCRDDCTFDNELCNQCGNGQIDEGEQCDGDDLGRDTCASIMLQFSGGELVCTAECTHDTSMCCYPALHGCDVNADCCNGNCIDLLCGL